MLIHPKSLSGRLQPVMLRLSRGAARPSRLSGRVPTRPSPAIARMRSASPLWGSLAGPGSSLLELVSGPFPTVLPVGHGNEHRCCSAPTHEKHGVSAGVNRRMPLMREGLREHGDLKLRPGRGPGQRDQFPDELPLALLALAPFAQEADHLAPIPPCPLVPLGVKKKRSVLAIHHVSRLVDCPCPHRRG